MICSTCSGTKYITVEREPVCNYCDGNGKLVTTTRVEIRCNYCNGTGRAKYKEKMPCPTCHGKGKIHD